MKIKSRNNGPDQQIRWKIPISTVIVLQAGLAGLGCWYFAWGALGLSRAAAMISSISYGLIVGGLVLKKNLAKLASKPSSVRRWSRAIAALQAGLLISFLLCILNQLDRIGIFPHPFESRGRNFSRLVQAIEHNYPYLAEKDLNLGQLHQSYLPLVEGAASDAEYHTLVAEFLSEMSDAHSGLIQPRYGIDRHYFGTGKALSDGIVLDRVGETAQKAGVLPGAQLLVVDGIPAEVALTTLPHPLRAGSTPWQSQHLAAFHLLSTTNPEMVITYIIPGAQPETATLIWPGASVSQPFTHKEDPATPLITSEHLTSGIVRITIPTFSRQTGHDLVSEFDRVLNNVLDASGIIIDLRGNGGGDSRIADQIAGRFLENEYCYGQDRFITRSPLHAWRQSWNYCVRPRSTVYEGPVVLLIDTANMSSAEQFIAALSGSGRSVTIGRQTAGASGNPITFRLSGGGKARISTAAFYLADGTLIEGSGFTPDYPVIFTIQDFQQGRDPDLDTALILLSS